MHPMPTLKTIKIELHGRRINSEEVRTKIDSEKLTITAFALLSQYADPDKNHCL